MASTYGNDLRLEEIGDGEQSGTWGATTNTNLELIAEALSFGTEAITTNADTHTTTIADGATDPGRSLYLKYTGTLDSTCTITIAPNSISKTWYIENGTSGSQSIIVSQGSGANVTIPTGQTKIVYSDGAGSGAAMAEIGTLGVTNLAVTTNATVGGTLGVTGVLTGTSLDISGNVDIDGTLETDALSINSTAVTSTAAELNILDGVTATTAELNIMDGVTATTAELNIMDGVTSTTAELNILDGVTSTAAELNQLDAITRGSILYGNSSGATARLAKGSANQLLQSDGTDISWATVSGSDSRQSYVTNATVAARAAVFLNNDGTVDQTGSYSLADNDVVVSTFNDKLCGAYGAQYDGHAGSSAYKDSGTVADRRHVTIYKYRIGTNAANARYVVSAVAADGTMTHGTPAAFNSSGPMNNCNVKYNANIDRFIAVYDYGGWESGGSYGGIAVAIGTLNASNNTVAWTHTTNLGNAGSEVQRGFCYEDGNSSIETPSFSVADDGSHLMILHGGSYNNQSNNSTGELSVKAVTLNAGNNTASGGSWLDIQVSSGTKYDWASLYPKSIFWHQNSSQHIVNARKAGGVDGEQDIYLFTVSGTTPTQVGYALGPIGSGGHPYGGLQSFPQIQWYNVTSTKLWGIGVNTSAGVYVSFYEMTVGSGSISNLKTKVVRLVETKQNGANLSTSLIATYNAMTTAAVNFDSNGIAYILYKAGNTMSGDSVRSNVAVIKMIYDETNVGALVSCIQNEVASDTTIIYPQGGDFVTYDTGRNFLFTLGTNRYNSSAADYQIVAQTINAANNGSGLNPIGIHDSSSSASSGATITVAQADSVVSGFSSLNLGQSQFGGGKRIGYAIAATKVFVTADGNGG